MEIWLKLNEVLDFNWLVLPRWFDYQFAMAMFTVHKKSP